MKVPLPQSPDFGQALNGIRGSGFVEIWQINPVYCFNLSFLSGPAAVFKFPSLRKSAFLYYWQHYVYTDPELWYYIRHGNMDISATICIRTTTS